MKYLYIVLILICSNTFAQTSFERKIGEFDKIIIYNGIKVNFEKSNEDKVSISGRYREDLVVLQKNKTIKIKMKIKKIFNGAETKVTIYYTSLETLVAGQGSKVVFNNKIEQKNINLKAREGAQIIAEIDVSSLSIKCKTGAIVTLKGKAKHQENILSTGGIYRGSKLNSYHTQTTIWTGGVANVQAEQSLKTKIFLGGDIFIYSSPEQFKLNKILGGRVFFK